MKILQDILQTALPVLLALALAVSCGIDLNGGGEEPDNGSRTGTPIQLTFSVPNSATAKTKAIDAVTQTGSQNYFHGMADIRLLPFNVTRPITASDNRLGAIPSIGGLSSDSYQASNYAFLFPNVPFIPVGTTSMLVYGLSAGTGDEGTTAFKRRYGSLPASNLNAQRPNDITFSPELIWTSSAFPSEAATLAGYLTTLANKTFTATYHYDTGGGRWHSVPFQLKWKDAPVGSGLDDIFNRFVNKTNDAYSLMGLSSQLTAAMLTDIYASLKSYNSTDDSGYMYVLDETYSYQYYTSESTGESDKVKKMTVYNALRDLLTAQIESWRTSGIISIGSSPDYTITFVRETQSENLRNFPDCYGLPSGAIGVQWNGSDAFNLVAQFTNGINKYCYPPRLWYYANSRIATSSVQDNVDQYQSPNTTYDRWNDILTHYTSGGRVADNTQAVAVVDPLQYGVALLEVTLNRTSATIPDAAGDNIAVKTGDTNNFPLTGLFVGGQRQQRFDFTPIGTEEYVMFDSDFYTGNPTAYLSSTGNTGPVRSLVLQTVSSGERDVYLVAEFRNDSGAPFQGHEGMVLPGAKFYLLGELKFSNAASPGGGVSFNSVFVKDYKTTATLSVTTLANARNVIPNLSVPQLDLGVAVTFTWKQATPTSVPMY